MKKNMYNLFNKLSNYEYNVVTSAIFVLLLFVSNTLKADTIAKITGVSINDNNDRLSISVITDKPVKRNSYRTIKPNRIILEISPAELALKEKNIVINKSGIKRISFSESGKNIIKSIIELDKLIEYDITVKDNVTIVNLTKIKEPEVINPETSSGQEPVQKEQKPEVVEVKTEIKPEVKPTKKIVVAPKKEPEPKIVSVKPKQELEKKIVVEPKKEVSIKEIQPPEEEFEAESGVRLGSAEVLAEAKKPIKRKLKKGSLDQIITLELVNADLLTTLRSITDGIGYNLIASKSVVGTITLTLRDVPLKRTLDAMLNMNGFSYVVEGNIIEVGTTTELSSEDEQGKLITQSFVLNFAKADAIQTPLKAVLSKNGSIQIDARTNTLLVTDTMPKLRQAALLIEKLDTTVKQVMIEAKLIEVSTTKEDELGIKWQATKGAGSASATGPTSNYPEIDMGAESKSGSVSAGFYGVLQIGTIASGHNLGIILNALANSTDANILANPSVVTLDNKTAKINITSEYPWLSAFNQQTGVPTYSTTSTGITLEVTPQVNASDYVTMLVKPTVSSIVSPGPPPVVDKREAQTEVMIKSGDTLVIGGLLKEEEVTKLSKVPFLGDIPLIGFLFKDKFTQKTKKDLIIFITPHIL